MAKVLALCTSGRRNGWTHQLFDAACSAAESVSDIQVLRIDLQKYEIKPCMSCFCCIRDPNHKCVKRDTMGKNGELAAEIESANAILIADPVYLWGATALCHLFFERMYPNIWSGNLNGMPFASISCASNSGFQYEAAKEIQRHAFHFGLRLIGSEAVHLSYFKEGMGKCEELGKKLAEAALKDAEGREKVTDAEKFAMYNSPWNVIDNYAENLTLGTFNAEDMMPAKAIREGTFERDTAIPVLAAAKEKLDKFFEAYNAGDYEAACTLMSDGSALWTEATWREFLERDVIGVSKPSAYRPVDDML